MKTFFAKLKAKPTLHKVLLLLILAMPVFMIVVVDSSKVDLTHGKSYAIDIQFVDTVEDATEQCSLRSPHLDYTTRQVRGCAKWSPSISADIPTVCSIITIPAWGTVTHELFHCFVGHFHEKPKLKSEVE